MQDQFDRVLDGKERDRERIAIKRNENTKKKLQLEIELNNNQAERIQIENESREAQIKELDESIEIGKKLVNGAKIKDAVPKEKLYGKNSEGGDEVGGKV